MEYGRYAGGRNLAYGTSRQGDLDSAEFVGNRFCCGGAGGGTGGALLRMARGILRRHSTGDADVVDSAGSAGIGDVGAEQNFRGHCRASWGSLERRSRVELSRQFLGNLTGSIFEAHHRAAAV